MPETPEPGTPFPKFPAVTDSSQLTTFDSCPLKWYRSSCLNLASQYPSIHLHAGGAFAHALEKIRRNVWEHGQDYDTALVNAYPKYVKFWGDFPNEQIPARSGKTFERVWGAVEDYFREYPIESDYITPYEFDSIDGAPGRLGIEYTFSIPLMDIPHPDTGDPVIFAGRFDLFGLYKSMLAVVDEKTTAALGESWPKQWTMRGQFLGYLWALQQAGFNANIALVRGIAILKTKYTHLEVPKQYPQHMIDKWADNMRFKLRQMILYYNAAIHSAGTVEEPKYEEAERFFPMSFGDGCNSYGPCMFTDLCTSSTPSEWYSGFAIREWNPLEIQKGFV